MWQRVNNPNNKKLLEAQRKRQTLEEKGKEDAAQKIMAVNEAVKTVNRYSLSLPN